MAEYMWMIPDINRMRYLFEICTKHFRNCGKCRTLNWNTFFHVWTPHPKVKDPNYPDCPEVTWDFQINGMFKLFLRLNIKQVHIG